MTVFSNIYDIPKENIPKFEKKFRALIKRANKIGIEPPVFMYNGEFFKEFEDENGNKFNVLCVSVSVSGESPKFAGWTFVSFVDYDKNTGLKIFRNISSGYEVPVEYRDNGSVCEHCNVNRYRRKLFIVRHDSGEFKQIGSTCVKDFLGNESPDNIAKACEIIAGIDEFMDNFMGLGDGSKKNRYYDLEKVLAITHNVIKTDGWNPRSKETVTEPATATIVEGIICDPKNKVELNDTDFEMARKSIDWVRSFEDRLDKLNNYEYNIYQLAKLDELRLGDFGFGCSIMNGYINYLNKLSEAENIDSEWVGEIKKRYEFNNVEVTYVKEIEGYYGLTVLVKFLTEDGNILSWFATNCPNVERGEHYNIRATVKKHSEYNDIKETLVNRVFFKK